MESEYHAALAFVGLLEGLTKKNDLRTGRGSLSTSDTCGETECGRNGSLLIDSYPWVICPLPIFVVPDTMKNEVDVKMKKSMSAERVLTGW